MNLGKYEEPESYYEVFTRHDSGFVLLRSRDQLCYTDAEKLADYVTNRCDSYPNVIETYITRTTVVRETVETFKPE